MVVNDGEVAWVDFFGHFELDSVIWSWVQALWVRARGYKRKISETRSFPNKQKMTIQVFHVVGHENLSGHFLFFFSQG